MKYSLLILLTFIFIDCVGQKKDTSGYHIIGDVSTEWGVSTFIGGFGNKEWPPKQDTVRVLLLVCDTMGAVHTSVGSLLPSSQAYNEGRMMWWQLGYLVKEKVETDQWVTHAQSMVGEFLSYWKPVQYLDQNKKPLSNIVVWISKEIK